MTASFGCAIKFGPGAARANREAGVRLAVPPCPLHLPLSPLTAETRIAPPPSLRDREADAAAAARLNPATTAPKP